MEQQTDMQIKICSKLLMADPENIDLYWRRGLLYLRTGVDTTTRPWGEVRDWERYERAIQDFKLAQSLKYTK